MPLTNLGLRQLRCFVVLAEERPRVLRAYAAACPAVKVELTEFDVSEPEAGLDDGRSDVAIVSPPIQTEGVQLATLAIESRVACPPGSHRLADRDGVSIHDNLSEPIIGARGSVAVALSAFPAPAAPAFRAGASGEQAA